uniref:Putative ixodes 10 kDa peptide protein n=1 Tax=Ixodes ricinus TaxID=34613 RepID=A0A0K8R3W2_IXORI
MLPFSEINLVVFAVVLVLPALQSGGFLSGTEIHYDCMDILDRCGEIKCHLEGSGDLNDYDPKHCTLECAGSARPRVPHGVCSGDLINCTSSTRESLRNWQQTLESTLNTVLRKWCQSFPKE